MENVWTPVVTVFVAFLLSVLLTSLGIKVITKLKMGQNIREDGPQAHLQKAGTPTMGGMMFVMAFFVGSLVVGRFSAQLAQVLFLTGAFAVIGFIDDLLKFKKHENEGLKAWQKWALQCLVAALFVVNMILGDTSTLLSIPFTSIRWDLGYGYYVLSFFAILAFVNGVNFTDGLDGLAGSVTAVVAAFFIVVCYLFNSDLYVAPAAMLGALLGFLCFNVNPAKIFMGDTGSLALGGFVGAMALILNIPLVVVIVGIVYVAEVVSVILQVAYFKATHGRRLFKMAPIHHHFELKGWKETRVVGIFTIVTILAAVLALLSIGLLK